MNSQLELKSKSTLISPLVSFGPINTKLFNPDNLKSKHPWFVFSLINKTNQCSLSDPSEIIWQTNIYVCDTGLAQIQSENY